MTQIYTEKRWITHGRAILGGNQTLHHQRGIAAAPTPKLSLPSLFLQQKSLGAEVMSSDGAHINI